MSRLTLEQRSALRAYRADWRKAKAAYDRTHGHRWLVKMGELVKLILPLTVRRGRPARP